MLKLDTHEKIKEFTFSNAGASYDEIIIAALQALHKERENKEGLGLETEEET